VLQVEKNISVAIWSQAQQEPGVTAWSYHLW